MGARYLTATVPERVHVVVGEIDSGHMDGRCVVGIRIERDGGDDITTFMTDAVAVKVVAGLQLFLAAEKRRRQELDEMG